jgi:hypothetical protein
MVTEVREPIVEAIPQQRQGKPANARQSLQRRDQRAERLARDPVAGEEHTERHADDHRKEVAE